MNARLRGLGESLNARPIVKTAVPILVLVLVATMIATNPASQPLPSAPAGSQVADVSPSTDPGTDPGMSPAPTGDPEPWADLVLGPVVALARFEPTNQDRAGVNPRSGFRLESLDETPAAELAKGVEAYPPTGLRIRTTEREDVAFIDPIQPLKPGELYRFRLVGPTGALGGTWAFQTQGPLQVVMTLPDDQTTDVPVDTGIEITFDQDGVEDLAGHFTIVPEVPGRFELHQFRTWVFVPAQPLAYSTAYRVTLTAGVAITGSKQALESGVAFRFETEAAPGPREMRVDFASTMSAIRPGEEPSLFLERNNGRDGLDALPVEIYRLPDLDSTMAAARKLTGQNGWLRASHAGLVATDGLRRVATFEAPIHRAWYGTLVMTIPVRLDRGAYLVVVPRRTGDAQSILQVGNLSAFATSTETRSVVWVNDLAGPTSIGGAVVATSDGSRLGVTSPNGVAEFDTPASMIPTADNETEWYAEARLVSIQSPDGRWLVAALGSSVSWLEGGADSSFSQAAEPSERWWLLLNTDREEYRQTDTINVWGRASSRDSGSPASSIELRLRPARGDADVDIARIPVHPTARGTFAASIPISSLPRSVYRIDLLIGGRRVTSTWISVGEIVKPSYRLEVTTDREAYLDGEPIEVTVRATFFDGTAVPSLDLNVSTKGLREAPIATDGDGIARITVKARYSPKQPDGYDGQTIFATPTGPEQGEISESADVIVFPTEAWLTEGGSLHGTTLSVDGRLAAVDFPGLNASFEEDDWRWPSYADITGGPLANQLVSIVVTRIHPVRRQVGTAYDFIEKKVAFEYEWHDVKTSVGAFAVRTDSDGRYHLSIDVESASDSYEARIRSTDEVGRPIVGDVYVSQHRTPQTIQGPSFLIRGYCGSRSGSTTVGLDDRFELRMHDGDGSTASEGRFLWLVNNRGLRDVQTGTSPEFSKVTRTADLPQFVVRGVQVTTAGYAVADAYVSIDLDDLTIDVRLTPDQKQYAPAGRATVDIETKGPDGRPIAADVIVQGIDEKLYAIGAAREINVLEELHRYVSSGILQSFTSHRTPFKLEEGGCGATGGGGEVRDDFGDVVVFDLVRTGADGRASVSFDLLDDLTSWRVSAMALTGDHRAGTGSTLLPVGLPFFVEGVLAPEYVVGDAPVLRVRAYGDALGEGAVVRFTIRAPSLGLDGTSVDGVAYDASRIALPALTAGTHRIRISAEDPAGRSDTIIRTIRVVPSRLRMLIKHYDLLTPSFVPEGGEGLTSYTVTDAGRGALIPRLMDLVQTRSARFDGLAAADAARELLIEEFGFKPDSLPAVAFNQASFERRGIVLLPYAGRDAELTALAALTVPERVDVDSVRSYLRNRFEGEGTTREGRVIALAGLAGIGEPVLTELQALRAEPDLTIREWLWLALGLAAVGDENGARDIERRLLDEDGQRLGPWVRLEVGFSIDDTHNAGRLLLMLTARLGEDFSRDVLQYLDDHPSRERLITLEQLAYVRAELERLPRETSRFAWTAAGERHEVTLERGRSTSIVLTAEQRATFRMEPISGELAVITSWTGPGPLPTGDEANITRTISPATNVTERSLVQVTITTSFETLAPDGCWLITDVAPSGLAPIESWWAWGGGGGDTNFPYSIRGQRVSWCAYPRDPDSRTFTYLARVVSPGTFRWEPALIQSNAAPENGFATNELQFTIE